LTDKLCLFINSSAFLYHSERQPMLISKLAF